MKRLAFSGCVVLLLLAGCGGKKGTELLTDRADTFNRSLRWSSLSAAGTLISPENRRSMMDALAHEMANQRIVDYSIVDLSLDESKKKGSVVVEFSYYKVSDQELRYRREVQTWDFDPKQGNWFIASARTISDSAQ